MGNKRNKCAPKNKPIITVGDYCFWNVRIRFQRYDRATCMAVWGFLYGVTGKPPEWTIGDDLTFDVNLTEPQQSLFDDFMKAYDGNLPSTGD